MTVLDTDYVAVNDRVVESDKLENVWKETVVADIPSFSSPPPLLIIIIIRTHSTKQYTSTMCFGPTNALVCNKTLIQM
jgi:hypothetical protein